MDYSNRLLNNLSDLINDALDCNDSSPQDIYDTIKNTIVECRSYHKERSTRAYQLLSLLNGNRSFEVDTSLDDINASKKPGISSASQKDWTSFWEEYHYPEEVKDDGMRPWGHSDLEYMIANPTLTEDRISNFPGEQYTEEELNAMCNKAVSDQEKEKCREYNLREAEYYDKGAQVDADYEKVKSWVLPTEVDGLTGDVTVNLPDDLLKAANLKEGDQIQWVDNGDGSYKMVKVTEPLKMDEC